MERSRRYIGLIGIFMLVAINVVMAQQPIFRIGVFDEELGPISTGARLAVDEINGVGGTQGADGTFFRLELIVQPTGGGTNLTNAVANINQASVIAALDTP